MTAAAALRVLIIDDNAQDRADAKSALLHGSDRRYLFSEASSADQGLRLCRQDPPPDCVLLDLGLPDADELEPLAHMPRDEDDLLCAPVVVLTGSVQQGRNQAALRAGAQDYVGKAWLSPETLTKAVENAIERWGLMRDLQAERRLAAAARRAAQQSDNENRRILELNRMKILFLANMSHELRTPLAAIIGFSDLLHGGQVAHDSPEHARFQRHINTSAHHLLRLVDDVLDLTQIEAGRLRFVPAAVDLNANVDSVLGLLDGEIVRKHLQVSTEIQPQLGELTLDPIRLRQVLFNYLSNAIKFTPDGGHITLRAFAQGPARWRIEVADSGIGIAAADIQRLFIEFQQLESGFAKHHQGAGLGLALTRRLVEAQGGTVGVSSNPGRGSTFWAELPRVPRVDRGPA